MSIFYDQQHSTPSPAIHRTPDYYQVTALTVILATPALHPDPGSHAATALMAPCKLI